MAAERVYQVLFFIQSAAFTVFIINHYQWTSPVFKPVGRLREQCEWKPNGTREIFATARPTVSNNTKEAVPVGFRGPISNCTFADVQKRPGVVMLTTANLAYVDVVLNMLRSVRRAGVCTNTTVVAEDQKAYTLLSKLAKGDPAVRILLTDSGEMDTKEHPRGHRSQYYGLLNKRQAYVLSFLEQGLEVLFSDSDTFWFRDPFPHFQGDFDMALRGWDKKRTINKSNYCAGFIYLKPNSATIEFVKKWVNGLDDGKKKGTYPNDQGALNALLHGDKPHINVKVLEADLFPWGPTFFDPKWQKQNHSTVVMHAASIRGHPAKMGKFKAFGMWLVNDTDLQR